MRRARALLVLGAVLVGAWVAIHSEPPHAERQAAAPQEVTTTTFTPEPELVTTTTTVAPTTLAPTTTEAPPTTVALVPPSAPVVVRVATEWPTSLQPCGGDLPPCYVKDRESHGDYNARNPSPEAACGAWQIITSTWNGFGGYASACDAPPAVQDEKARELWADGAGCSHWSACS